MGCFNVSCVLSGISMYADKVALIPLIKTEYPNDITGLQGAYTCSNEGEQIFYEVMALPIYGELNTYGSIEDIEKNKNTEILEGYFGRTIDEIAEMSSNAWRGDTEDNEKVKLPRVGSFVHRGIYDKFSSLDNCVDEVGKQMNLYLSGGIHPQTLRLMGFVQEKIADTHKRAKERYNQKYVHPDFPDLTVWTDGSYSEIELENRKVNHIYHMEDFHELLLKTYKRSPVDVDAMVKLCDWGIQYDGKVYDAQVEKECLSGLDDVSKVFRIISRLEHRPLTLGHGSFRSFFTKIYGNHLEDPFIRSEYIKMKRFNMNMFMCNKTYMPTMNGCQHGNAFAERRLHEAALFVINEKILEREE